MLTVDQIGTKLGTMMKKAGWVQIKIEKGIPMRPRTRFPFKKMGIGDSFFLADKKARTVLYASARSAGVKLSIRREGAGIRVWRAA